MVKTSSKAESGCEYGSGTSSELGFVG
ncbi:MAG: hypothetical protein RL421_931, partial [Actinomycetota bacterium]